MTSAHQNHTVDGGLTLPAVGFGTYPLRGQDGVTAIVDALHNGYRLIDTAVNYENEADVGEALRRSGVQRQDVLLQTKIPGRHHARDLARRSLEESCERLSVDYLDVALIHWPNPSQGLYVQAWSALIEAQQAGLVRAIGVSNFAAEHLERIVGETGTTPAVNQIELHPYFPQEQMRAVNARLGVVTQAWSPLGKRSAPFGEPPVARAAQANGVTPAQVILRWHLQVGSLPLPKSADPGRQRANLDVLAFELTDDEVVAITALGRPDGRLFGGDPQTHEEM